MYVASFDYKSCMIGVSSARHLLNPKSGHSTGAVRHVWSGLVWSGLVGQGRVG